MLLRDCTYALHECFLTSFLEDLQQGLVVHIPLNGDATDVMGNVETTLDKPDKFVFKSEGSFGYNRVYAQTGNSYITIIARTTSSILSLIMLTH